jgi:uncharacterized protein (TIGR02147 family)
MSAFNFTGTKAYLRHYISQLPKRGRGEISRIADHLRVSGTLVSQVLAGEKSFTAEQTQALISYLGLSGVEADYIMFLVQYERAGSSDLKKYWATKLSEAKEQSLKLSHRVKADTVLSEQERTVFYSSTIYSAIRLFTSVGHQGKGIGEICERFDLPRNKAAEILNFLIGCGLLLERDGRYFMGAQKTHLEQKSPHFLRHHSIWRINAINHNQEVSDRELMYTAPVSISKDDFDLLREEMAQFIKKFLDRVHSSPAEEVACLNLDFYWVKK